jgi:hypothetical protein
MKQVGIYRKFDIKRTDGTSDPGGKHDGCSYFALDLNHDPHAKPAILAYAESCRRDYPELASDLLLIAEKFEFKKPCQRACQQMIF